MKLNEIFPMIGAKKKRKIIGRGIGSGSGKTAGKGTKGQRSRSGVSFAGFEGGQMPLTRRIPKRGFTSLNKVSYQVINVDEISYCIEAGKLKEKITKEDLVKAGLIRNSNKLLKLLARGDVSQKFTIEVDAASKTAIAVVEKAGGSVVILGKAA